MLINIHLYIFSFLSFLTEVYQRDENLFTSFKNTTITKKESLKDITNNIYAKMNDKLKNRLGVTFTDGLVATKNLNLEKKKSNDLKKKEKRESVRDVKKKIQQVFVEIDRKYEIIPATFGLEKSLEI